jgi:hypothetical protein
MADIEIKIFGRAGDQEQRALGGNRERYFVGAIGILSREITKTISEQRISDWI